MLFRSASGKLKVVGVWWFRGMAYSKSEGTCVNAGCSIVRDTCVLITVKPSKVSPWLIFCLRLVRTLKGKCWVVGERMSLQVASAVLLLKSVQDWRVRHWCMGFWQTPTQLVSSFSHEVDDGLLLPSRCGRAFLQEVFTLLQAESSFFRPVTATPPT